MAAITIKNAGFRCERCGHEWTPRGPRKENRTKGADDKPRLCPSCKTPYWQTPKKAKS